MAARSSGFESPLPHQSLTAIGGGTTASGSHKNGGTGVSASRGLRRHRTAIWLFLAPIVIALAVVAWLFTTDWPTPPHQPADSLAGVPAPYVFAAPRYLEQPPWMPCSGRRVWFRPLVKGEVSACTAENEQAAIAAERVRPR